MLGSTEKVALEVTARRIRTGSIPSAMPARHARMIKITHTTAISATITPQTSQIPPLFNCCRTVFSIPIPPVYQNAEIIPQNTVLKKTGKP